MRRCTVAHQAAAELRAIQLQIGGVLQRAQAPRRLSRTTQTSADVISAADRGDSADTFQLACVAIPEHMCQ